MEISEYNVKKLFAFMNERHTIYIKRQNGDPWPWTEDVILQTYSFTNVFRTLDRGTLWLTNNIILPHVTETYLLFFNILVYRCHNRIETAQRLGWIRDYGPESAKACEHYVQDMANAGQHVFTNAYMVTGSIRENGVIPKSKVHQMFGITFPYAWEHITEIMPVPGDTLESAFNKLALHVPGIGRFVAYEIITDLRHTSMLENATDIMTWCNPGPGARRGLGRLLGRTDPKHLSVANTEECLEHMRYLLKLVPEYLPGFPPTEIRDIEMSLCELDKYERVRLGQGRPRRKFVSPDLRKHDGS